MFITGPCAAESAAIKPSSPAASIRGPVSPAEFAAFSIAVPAAFVLSVSTVSVTAAVVTAPFAGTAGFRAERYTNVPPIRKTKTAAMLRILGHWDMGVTAGDSVFFVSFSWFVVCFSWFVCFASARTAFIHLSWKSAGIGGTSSAMPASS